MHIAAIFACWIAGAHPVGMTPQLVAYVYQQAQRDGVPVAIATSVIWHESRWEPAARHVNPDGTIDMGLMQINSATWRVLVRSYGGTIYLWPYDPYANVRIGLRYLAHLHELMGDWWDALAAYNAGPAAVEYSAVPVSTGVYAWSVARQAGL